MPFLAWFWCVRVDEIKLNTVKLDLEGDSCPWDCQFTVKTNDNGTDREKKEGRTWKGFGFRVWCERVCSKGVKKGANHCQVRILERATPPPSPQYYYTLCTCVSCTIDEHIDTVPYKETERKGWHIQSEEWWLLLAEQKLTRGGKSSQEFQQPVSHHFKPNPAWCLSLALVSEILSFGWSWQVRPISPRWMGVCVLSQGLCPTILTYIYD